MNEIDDILSEAVTEQASFGAAEVAGRVARRRRRRRSSVAAIVGLLLVGVVVAVPSIGEDESSDLDVRDEPHTPAVSEPMLLGPEWGWLVPDLDGDGYADIIDGSNGQVFLTILDGVTPLEDAAGALMEVPVEGDRVFTCNPDGTLLVQWDTPLDEGRFSRRLEGLEVTDGVGEWVPSPSFVFAVGEARLPVGGTGCEGFGTRPPEQASGILRDAHVEATDLYFAECESLPAIEGGADDPKIAELEQRLLSDGLLDEPFVTGTNLLPALVGRLPIALGRRYQPTIDWLKAHSRQDEICLMLVPPVGFYNEPPPTDHWELVGSPRPSDRQVVLDRAPGECVSDGERFPPIVRYFDDRIEIALPYAQSPVGPETYACREGGNVTVTLAEPVGERSVVMPSSPETLVFERTTATPGSEVSFWYAVADLGEAAAVTDVAILQSVDDPTVQYQVSDMFLNDPSVRFPGPMTSEPRWGSGAGRLAVPEDAPTGDYTFVFVDQPWLNGRLRVDETGASLFPSQVPVLGEADGIAEGLGLLDTAERYRVLAASPSAEGWWLLTRAAVSGALGDESGEYGVDFVSLSEYGELVLLDRDGVWTRAIPLPGLVPTWLIVLDDVVLAGRTGDGGLPDDVVVSVDRSTFEATVVVVPYETREVEGRWPVASAEQAEAFRGLVGFAAQGAVGTRAISWVGETVVDVDGLRSWLATVVAPG